MATIAFYLVPAHGHINPTLPVMAALVRRGERVIAYATPDLADKLAPTGVEFRSYAPLPFDHNRPPANLGAVAAGLLEFALSAAQGMIDEAVRERVDLVVHDSMAPWGRAVACKLGLPSICSISTFALPLGVPRSVKYAAMKALVYTQAAPYLPTIRAQSRRLSKKFLVPHQSLFELFRNRADLNIVYTSSQFQPFSERLGSTYRFVGPSVPETVSSDPELLEALDEHRLIYVSLGTIFNDRSDFFRAVLAALDNFDGRVLLSIGKKVDPKSLGAIPANTMLRAHVPQLAILERAALFITHGGMNSVSEGLYHGVPLLVYPQAGDQMLVAERVTEVGAGIRLSKSDLSPDRLRAHIHRVLTTDRYAESARSIGASLRAAGGAAEAVAQIEQFMRLHGIVQARLA